MVRLAPVDDRPGDDDGEENPGDDDERGEPGRPVSVGVVGALFITWGRTKSDFSVYRILVACSRVLWGDRVHGFYQVGGALMIIALAAVALTG